MSELQAAARRALSLMDLTTLNDDDTIEKVRTLCQRASTAAGYVAAVCIYPRFIPYARNFLEEAGVPEVCIATVVNFPHGDDDLAVAYAETKAAVAYGADEVDLVFPYRAFMDGDLETAQTMIAGCKAICGDDVTLKVILETGVLQSAELIRSASELAIRAGADFIKTSTGKVDVNATLDAARIMLEAIRDSGGLAGFKPAGGIRTTEDAAAYLALADEIMGPEWATPFNFRLGASSLLDDLLATLGHEPQVASDGQY